MFAWQMAKYLFTQDARGRARFVSMQNHYNLLYREEEREMNPLCEDQGVALIPWSPMARGYLARTGATLKDTVRANSDDFTNLLYRNSDIEIVDRNAATAAQLGVKPAQTALAWLLSKPAVTSPIVGASKLEQLDDAIAAVEVELADDDIAQLEELYQPRAVAGHA
jgi:aryl-alcohol dehydrogenase (NADP+)